MALPCPGKKVSFDLQDVYHTKNIRSTDCISGQEDGSSCLYSHLQLSVWREHHCSFANGFPVFCFLHPDHSVHTAWFRYKGAEKASRTLLLGRFSM